MNHLIPQQQFSATTTRPEYVDGLPPWLNYLIAAFPAAKLSENTFAVFEDAFGEEDPVVMRAASRAAVNELRFFPSVYELRRIVAREAERHEAAQYRVPDWLHYRRLSSLWPVCPGCGERVNPEWDCCPACEDLILIRGGGCDEKEG
mgnify:FL=1